MTAGRKRRGQAIWRAFVGLLVILSVVSSDFPHPTFIRGQTSRPDDVLLVYETVPNLMLVEVTSVRPSSQGVMVEFAIRNPMNTLYMPFRINGADATVEPNSDRSGFWANVGLIPARTTNTYTVFFNSTGQSVTIESPLLDANALAFNYLELASSFLLPGALDSTQVSEAVAAVLLTFEQRLIGLVDFGPCLAGIPTIGELDDCVSAVKQFVGDEVFAEMLVEIFARLGINMSLETIADGLKAWAFIEKWAKVADGIVYVALAGWSHSLVNRYRLQPVTLDPDQLPPWPPRLIAPVGDMVDVASSFEWRQAGGAVAYEFELSRDPEFSDLLIHTTTVPPSFDLSERLLRSTVYYWRVRSIGAAGITPSNWSVASFMTEPYPGPTLIAPAGSAVSLPTEFRWEAVEGATSYRIKVSDSGFFLDLLVDEVTTATTYSPDVSLEPDKTYYWSVTAYYADGGWGSSAQGFSTETTGMTAEFGADGKVYLGTTAILDIATETSGCFGDGEISYSPDRQHFLVILYCFEGDNEAFLFDVSGRIKRRITEQWDYINYTNYKWSPDSRSFVYQRINSCCVVPPPNAPLQGLVRFDVQNGQKTMASPYKVVNVANDDVLNVRSEPGVGNPIVGTIPPDSRGVLLTGDAVKIESSLWVRIDYGSVTGWANSYYLSDWSMP